MVGLLAPWPLQILVDNVLGAKAPPDWLSFVPADTTSLLFFAVLGGLAITLVSNGLNIFSNYINTRLEQRIVLDFRADLFSHAQKLSVAYHDQRKTGLMMYAINFEAGAAGGLIMAVQPLAQSLLTLVGMFWIAFTIDGVLALLSLTILPFLYYSVGYYAKHIQPQLLDVKNREGLSLSIIVEALNMVRVITAFNRESYEDDRFRVQGSDAVNARVRVTVRQTMFSLVVNMTTAIGTALVLGVGAWHALEGQLTVGTLLVMLSYIAAVYKPLEQISYTIGSLQDRFVALGMAYKILDMPPDVQDLPGSKDIYGVTGDIELQDVSFTYPGRAETLKKVNFKIKAGQVVAVVGPTGAGKTTVMSLIPRFYDPQEGRVLIDGRDVRDFTLKSLREQISVVLQEPVLFSGNITENIRYGRLDATHEEIVEAAKAANAHDFITALPEGYDTNIGERGAQLSGGERQRICVARAFLKNAPILILDEPTSAIDSKTESVILDALDRLMEGRTTFMVAHRLSTIRHSDLILVMNKGELVESGTHDELMSRDGLYKQMYEMQTSLRRTRRMKLLPFIQTEADVESEQRSEVPGQSTGEGTEVQPTLQEGQPLENTQSNKIYDTIPMQTVATEPSGQSAPTGPLSDPVEVLVPDSEELVLANAAHENGNGHTNGNGNGNGNGDGYDHHDGIVPHDEYVMVVGELEHESAGTGNERADGAVQYEVVPANSDSGEEAGASLPVLVEDASVIPAIEQNISPRPTVSVIPQGVAELQDYMNSNPDSMAASLVLAALLSQEGQTDAALRLYRRILTRNVVHGFVNEMLSENVDAIEHKGDANARLHLVRGDLMIQQGRYVDAVAEYEKMLSRLSQE
jgi:ATP-binding cassette, subfamily B, bacterial